MAYVKELPSYKRQGVVRRWAGRILVVILGVFFTSIVLQGNFLRGARIQSDSMAPTLARGDILVTSPLLFGRQSLFGDGTWLDITGPARGTLILMDPPWVRDLGFFGGLLNAGTEISTLGNIHAYAIDETPDWQQTPVVRRVIAGPGDTVRISEGRVEVLRAGSDQYQAEQDAARRQWNTDTESAVDSWGDNGALYEMPALSLGKDEYFVLADHRDSGADSRTWGPIRSASFRGQVLFRTWPLRHFGLLP